MPEDSWLLLWPACPVGRLDSAEDNFASAGKLELLAEVEEKESDEDETISELAEDEESEETSEVAELAAPKLSTGNDDKEDEASATDGDELAVELELPLDKIASEELLPDELMALVLFSKISLTAS